MYSFVVLGLIPGTNFQITFQVWLDLLLMVVEIVGLWWLQKRGCIDELMALLPPRLIMTCKRHYFLVQSTYSQLKAYALAQWADWEEVTA